ncbi:MAG TPA: hypothetical protein VGI93_06375 [Steroidobacteraceae bacterium]
MSLRHLMLASILLAACSRQPPPSAPVAPPAAATPEAPRTQVSEAGAIPGSHDGESADAFFDPKNYPNAVQGSFVDPSKLTATERQYGMAPKRDSRVTYQEDVILMEHGDQAIREAKSDGMTFSFDGNAEHVSEIAVGKVVFATGRVVGRVGQVSRDGDTVTVKLAPVALTEVIKKGTFMLNSAFSPKDLIVYTAPDFPSTNDVGAQQSENLDPEFFEPQFMRARLMDPALPSGLGKDLSTRIPQQPPTLPAPTLELNKGLSVRPAIGSDGGIGVSFKYVKNGIVFDAYGQLVLPSPKVRFLLDIDTSGIETFGIEISGGTSLRMSISALADVERYINVNSTTVAPIDITLPCPIAGVPLALSFKTSFNLHTNFSAKTSTLTASGSWNLSGTMFAGFKGGSKSHETPTSSMGSSLAENVSGASLGINRIGGAINVRPMIGLGGFGFMTGVYLGITFTGDVVKQASQAMVDCHGASGSATIDSGAGYQLPAPFVAIVNGILSVFTKYRMDKEGTLKQGWGGPLFQINQDIPTGCAGLSGKAATKT